jgi:ATP phosphoribosyltransferase
MNGRSDSILRLAIPSDGEMYEPTLEFMKACGMPVSRLSPRNYTAVIPAVKGLEVHFQRGADITSKVEAGNVDLGVVGLDRFQEYRTEDGDTLLIMPDLGFGRCELVIGVPDAWVDVSTVADLADLSSELWESGRELRVATKYPRLVQRFLFSHGLNYFSLQQVTGTLEAAPAMGYADIIVDISATGVTMRENSLKTLEGGSVLTSEGCLIGNRKLLHKHSERLELTREVLERMEAYLNAGDYCRVTANIKGLSEELVSAQVLERPDLAGLQGPTISRVFAADGSQGYAVTVLVPKRRLTIAVDHFRSIGASSVSVSDTEYIFHQESRIYSSLLAVLGLG